jgi:hypothetical protein
VNGAGPGHNHQPGIAAFQDVDNLIPCLKNRRGSSLRRRQLFFKKNRRKYDSGGLNTKIICGIEHGLPLNLAA